MAEQHEDADSDHRRMPAEVDAPEGVDRQRCPWCGRSQRERNGPSGYFVPLDDGRQYSFQWIHFDCLDAWGVPGFTQGRPEPGPA